MTRNVYKEEGERSGFTISETTKGFKVDVWSVYADRPNKTYYIAFTDPFQPGFDRWNEAINEHGTTYSQLLLHFISTGSIVAYRTIKKTDQ